jgi:diguanylate cyclase (GGDEF)-like protein
VDSLAEVLKHANHILMLSEEGVEKSSAYSFAIMVFFRHKMFSQAVSYIEEADIYIKNHEIKSQNLFQIWINELDIFASSGQLKKYYNVKEKLTEYMENSISLPYYGMLKNFYDLHLLYGEVLLSNQIEFDINNKAIQFKEVLSSLRCFGNVGENYGILLTPLFDFFKDFFEKEEFIDEISHITTYNMNVNERLVLYKYLIENIGIDKTRYHDIYESYVENLSIYFTNTQKNKTSEILTEILNFSLEKKLDVLNAKYHYDTLTGCYNRVFLSEIEEKTLEAGDVVIYLDLNDFKKINDTYGHDAGDKQLKIFADILMKHFENDVVLRLGGDEFVILTRGLPEDVLAKLDLARAEYLTHNLLKNRYGFSAGVLLPHGMAVHEAIGEADKAMYDSKKTGLPCIIREI